MPRIDNEENDQSYSLNRDIVVLLRKKLGSVTFLPKAAPSDTRGGWATRKKEEKV